VLKNRTERIVQALTDIDGEAEAERQAIAFVKQVLPVLDYHIPV